MAAVAQHAFAVHGFKKEELPDLWWNEKLWIWMNRKTATDVVTIAYGLATLHSISGRKGRGIA